ncbi:MAG: cytochrome P450 [Acidimicrobiales bacterium]|nr:cytochrome P450 [Acidimicrobiales bacterium]
MNTELATPRVNVLDPDFYLDPWEAYRWLRDEAPVFWDPVQEIWVISRHDDIVAIEKNGDRYSSFAGSRPKIDLRGEQSMINQDDPDHQSQRNLVARRFTPRAMRDHEGEIRAVVTEILDAVTPLGECEAIESIASRLPAIMISDLLGYPREQWERVRHWSEQIMLLSGQTSPDGAPHDIHPGLMTAIQDLYEVTVPLVHERKADPRDDLISLWATTEGWDLDRAMNEIVLVINGGAETTRTVIGSMIRELALQPEQRQLLVERPELLAGGAIDEFIRWVSPVLNMRRTATEDHDFHGQPISEGDELLLLYASANRDPQAFDHPDTLDVTREHNRHVAFGFGTHFCLGAHLARLELRVMFEELLRRIPDWDLIDPEEPRIMPATFARAYDRINIRFSPS